MSINADKSIGKPFLKSNNPLEKKWIICIKYKNQLNEPKEYKRTYDLNQPPFVVKGVVITNTNVVKAREKRAQAYINALIAKLDATEFDVNTGDFVVDKLDLPLKDYINDWLLWKKNQIKSTSLDRYKEKINVFQDWLYDNNLSDISLKRFDIRTLNKFLIYIQSGKGVKTDKQHNKSYNYYLTVFKNIYKYLNNTIRLKVDDITTAIPKVKEEDTDKHTPYNNVDKAFTDLTDYSYYLGLMAKCVYYTLHRPDTITQLQFKDFDLKNGVINIPSSKIKTGKKLQIRISKHLLSDIENYVNEYQPQPNDYFFGNSGMVKNTINLDKADVKMFGQNKTKVAFFKSSFQYFKNKKTTDKTLFTALHTLYGFKHSGIGYYKDAGLTDHQIIKITGHSNVSILQTYSRQYDAIIDEDLFNSLP